MEDKGFVVSVFSEILHKTSTHETNGKLSTAC